MKRLLIALAAAVAVSTASAIIKESQLFEDDSWSADFVVDSDDDSELAEYGGTQPTTIGVPYPCPSFGEKYLSLDTGDTMLWCTNTAAGTIYFDMALQFNPSASAPELAQGDSTKILLYQNAESNLVILAGASSLDRTPTSYVTTTKVAPGTWVRVTVSSLLGNDGYAFTVCINGDDDHPLTASGVSSFPSLTDDTTITKVGFSGSGALDNFVARTTDPYYDGPVGAQIGSGEGCEKYFSYPRSILFDCPEPISYQNRISISCSTIIRIINHLILIFYLALLPFGIIAVHPRHNEVNRIVFTMLPWHQPD